MSYTLGRFGHFHGRYEVYSTMTWWIISSWGPFYENGWRRWSCTVTQKAKTQWNHSCFEPMNAQND